MTKKLSKKRIEALLGLEKRAKIYLRGIGLTGPQIKVFFSDQKRCRVYQLTNHVRLSCFDKDLNQRFYVTYGIGSIHFNETMWTKTVG